MPGGPLVLWGIDPRRGRLVVACCDAAAALGIRPGMTVGEADSLARRGASDDSGGGAVDRAGQNHPPHDLNPLFLQHDGEADVEALRMLAEACAEQLSPIVALEPLDNFLWAGQTLHQPQALLMDVTGVGELYGDEDRLAASAAELLRRYRLSGRISIAATAGAAWALAHYRRREAGKQQAGGGRVETFIVPADRQRAALAPLPVAALRIRPETAAMLRRLGIDCIESLQRLPRGGLATRLGSDLLRRLDQALGEVDEPLPAHHAAAEDRASVDLEYPTSDMDILGHQLESLVRRITAQLSARQRGALRLVCRFDLENAAGDLEAGGAGDEERRRREAGKRSLEIRLGLFTPSATADHLMRLLSGALERQRLRTPAHRLVVAATMTGPLSTRQPMLAGMGGAGLEGGDEGSVADLAKLIDGLSSRLGRARVLGVDLTGDPLPEHAIRLRPLAGQPIGAVVPGRPMRRGGQNRRVRQRGGGDRERSDHGQPADSPTPWTPPAPSDPLRRPLAMLPQPIPLAAVPVTGERASSSRGADEPPRQLRHGGRLHRVAKHWGPERLETGWWSGPMQRRDYYRVETEEGSWLWIYHDLRTGRWWLHGYFS